MRALNGSPFVQNGLRAFQPCFSHFENHGCQNFYQLLLTELVCIHSHSQVFGTTIWKSHQLSSMINCVQRRMPHLGCLSTRLHIHSLSNYGIIIIGHVKLGLVKHKNDIILICWVLEGCNPGSFSYLQTKLV